ncbi:MAG TPA: DUF4825 domain-containing protein [Firmicutes bacterium]|nr:DUF4825 domain-containing protein [Bacillota bacterium]
MLNYKKPEAWLAATALVVVLAVIIGFAVNPRDRAKNFAARLLEHRTEYIGDNSKVGGIIMNLEYPENVEYGSFELLTGSRPFAVVVRLNTDSDTLNFYTEDLNKRPFYRNAVIMLSLIHNADNIRFVLDDGSDSHLIEFTRAMAESRVGGDLWEHSASQEQFERFLEMLESVEMAIPGP